MTGLNDTISGTSTLRPLTHLKLVLFVFGALVKWPVVAKPPDVVDLIEALNVVGDAVTLKDVLAVWDWCDSIDLQICMKVRQGTCPLNTNYCYIILYYICVT